MSYKVVPHIRETLKAYHGSEPYDPKDYGVYWEPKLSKYHRDNLVSLINAIGYGSDAIRPFHIFNTGDWVGEIAQKLSLPVIIDDQLSVSYTIDNERDRPNQTRAAIEQGLISWLRGRLHALDEKVSGPYCPINSNCHVNQAKAILEIE